MYLLAVLAGVALSASAQFVNVGSSGSSRLTSVTTDGWNRLYVSYLPSKLKTDGEDALKMKGFSVGYMRGISVTNKIPLYIEVGAAFQYRAEKEDAEECPDARCIDRAAQRAKTHGCAQSDEKIDERHARTTARKTIQNGVHENHQKVMHDAELVVVDVDEQRQYDQQVHGREIRGAEP